MKAGKHQHLELYKLHADLADRVSARREGINRLYVSLWVGVMALLAAATRLTGDDPDRRLLLLAGILGALLSVSWWAVIFSYRRLSAAKFAALDELEDDLPYPFFRREWELRKGYWQLTRVEMVLPWIFFVLSVFAVAIVCSVPPAPTADPQRQEAPRRP